MDLLRHYDGGVAVSEAVAFRWSGGSFTPTGSKILVRLDPKLSVTDGGIIIPDAYQRASWWGEAVAIGPGRWVADTGRRDEMDIAVGARVYFGAYNGKRVDHLLGIRDGHEYWLMEQWKRDFGDMAPDVYAVKVD